MNFETPEAILRLILGILFLILLVLPLIAVFFDLRKIDNDMHDLEELRVVGQRYAIDALNKQIAELKSLGHNGYLVHKLERVADAQNEPQKYMSFPTNCVNCGAPLHGNVCKFCDTEYR